jgi:hypothetical protein
MNDDIVGPVDLVVLEFPDGERLDEVADSLGFLVGTGLIRLYDILALSKCPDGSVAAFDVSELGDETGLSGFAGARSGMIDDSDAADAGEMLADGRMGLMLMYENAWAVPMVAATRRADGDVAALAHITGQQMTDALDALDKEG